MNQFVPGLPWAVLASRCVLPLDNAPIHTSAVDNVIPACGVLPLRLSPGSPDFQPIEEVLSEYSFALESAHHHYPVSADAFLHAISISSLDADSIASHLMHCLMEAVRNVPVLGGHWGVFADAFAAFAVERDLNNVHDTQPYCKWAHQTPKSTM